MAERIIKDWMGRTKIINEPEGGYTGPTTLPGASLLGIKTPTVPKESKKVANDLFTTITPEQKAKAEKIKKEPLGSVDLRYLLPGLRGIGGGLEDRASMASEGKAQSYEGIAPATVTKPAPAPTPGIGSLKQHAPGGIDTWTPAINMPSPVAKTPTLWDKTKGIASGIGKWAEDPKIARALMAAGLQTLATEPRRVPYSNAEMLGRAGIAGIGAFDTEVAKEAAAKETARKAGIEEREMVVKERAPKATAEATHFGQNIITDIDARTGKKVTGFPIYSGTKQIGIDPASPDQLAKMRAEAAKMGREGGGADEEEKFARLMYEKAYSETKSTEEANKIASNARAALKAWKADKSYVPGTEPTQSWWDSWLYKPEAPTEGRYVGGTQYTPEQIAAERKRRGL